MFQFAEPELPKAARREHSNVGLTSQIAPWQDESSAFFAEPGPPRQAMAVTFNASSQVYQYAFNMASKYTFEVSVPGQSPYSPNPDYKAYARLLIAAMATQWFYTYEWSDSFSSTPSVEAGQKSRLLVLINKAYAFFMELYRKNLVDQNTVIEMTGIPWNAVPWPIFPWQWMLVVGSSWSASDWNRVADEAAKSDLLKPPYTKVLWEEDSGSFAFGADMPVVGAVAEWNQVTQTTDFKRVESNFPGSLWKFLPWKRTPWGYIPFDLVDLSLKRYIPANVLTGTTEKYVNLVQDDNGNAIKTPDQLIYNMRKMRLDLGDLTCGEGFALNKKTLECYPLDPTLTDADTWAWVASLLKGSGYDPKTHTSFALGAPWTPAMIESMKKGLLLDFATGKPGTQKIASACAYPNIPLPSKNGVLCIPPDSAKKMIACAIVGGLFNPFDGKCSCPEGQDFGPDWKCHPKAMIDCVNGGGEFNPFTGECVKPNVGTGTGTPSASDQALWLSCLKQGALFDPGTKQCIPLEGIWPKEVLDCWKSGKAYDPAAKGCGMLLDDAAKDAAKAMKIQRPNGVWISFSEAMALVQEGFQCKDLQSEGYAWDTWALKCLAPQTGTVSEPDPNFGLWLACLKQGTLFDPNAKTCTSLEGIWPKEVLDCWKAGKAYDPMTKGCGASLDTLALDPKVGMLTQLPNGMWVPFGTASAMVDAWNVCQSLLAQGHTWNSWTLSCDKISGGDGQQNNTGCPDGTVPHPFQSKTCVPPSVRQDLLDKQAACQKTGGFFDIKSGTCQSGGDGGEAEPPPEEGSSSSGVLIAGLLLVAAGVGAFFMMRKPEPPPPPVDKNAPTSEVSYDEAI